VVIHRRAGRSRLIQLFKSPSTPTKVWRRAMSTRGKHLTVAETCEELGVARSTFYEWRAKGRAPRCIKLPNGDLRIRRAELDRWLAEREEALV
jgi:excisionase family DNA binding protein